LFWIRWRTSACERQSAA